jgi:hypothetical protein
VRGLRRVDHLHDFQLDAREQRVERRRPAPSNTGIWWIWISSNTPWATTPIE